MQPHKLFYKRNLPHYQPGETTFFLTYRLFGSIPVSVIKELKAEQERFKLKSKESNNEEIKLMHSLYFKKFDECLDKSLNEPYWLKEENIAQIVADSLHFNDEKEYDLYCFSIMPNHVHVVFTLLEKSLPLYAIMQKHKRFTGWQCNKALKRSGSFWQEEYYDHIVKDETELYRVIKYSLNNPVKAGFVKHWKDWKGNYLKPELHQLFTDL